MLSSTLGVLQILSPNTVPIITEREPHTHSMASDSDSDTTLHGWDIAAIVLYFILGTSGGPAGGGGGGVHLHFYDFDFDFIH